jgi:hypothetical protein
METLNRMIAQIIPQAVFARMFDRYEDFIATFLIGWAIEEKIPKLDADRFPYILVIKEVRDRFQLGLHDSKSIVESYREKYFKGV